MIELSLIEFAKILGMPPSMIERWIRQGRMPVKRKGDTCVFSMQALRKWAAIHNMTISLPEAAQGEKGGEQPENLHTAMLRGGFYYRLGGKTVEEVLRAAVDRMTALTEQDRILLFDSLALREQMMSTGIGNGVAVPHPRAPLGSDIPARIATFFLAEPVDYHAVDKKPVFVLFVLVAPTAKRHLHLLSRLSFCLRDAGFMQLLARVPETDTLLETIAEFDRRLDSPGS